MASGEITVLSLLDHLRIGVVMLDTSGRILLWSPVAEEILGWSGQRVVGHRFTALLGGSSERTGERTGETGGGPADDGEGRGPGAGARIYATLLREKRWRGKLAVRHAHGRQVRIEVRASLLRDSHGKPFVLANIVETGRLREVENDLAALDALFVSSPLGVAVFDSEGRFTRVNEALARLNGVSADELIGRTVHEVLPPTTAEEMSRMRATVLQTGRPVIDRVLTAPDGGARSLSYSRLTDRSGQVLGVSCTVMDITERRDAMANIERARQRLILLDDVGVALGDLLDVRQVAEMLAVSLVPRLADYSGVLLYTTVYHGELPHRNRPTGPLIRLGSAAKDSGPAVERMQGVGRDVTVEPGAIFGTVLATGVPRLITSPRELLDAALPGDVQARAAVELGVHSMIAVPLSARGLVLGLLVVSRAGDRAAFDGDDLALAMELGSRAGISLDNARLYAREREDALMLQRSLLPQQMPAPPGGVHVAYRYVPGSSGTEVGGDWFDVIHLAGGRVAFVVGDVTGHGLRAAATMGRLRTAVRTLAGLDLRPDELLSRVNDLADDLSPSGPEDPLMATCVYAVYDPSTRRCTLAKAGHVPPLLLTSSPGESTCWRAEPLELPSGAPLGVGGVAFQCMELEVEEGAVLVLYTDGLIETRGEDITEGLARLSGKLSSTECALSLEELCDDVIAEVGHEEEADDVALLMAQLGGLPPGSIVSWTFPARPSVVRRARGVVRRALHDWDLDVLGDTTALLVSELVTNSLRYAHGPISVRMVLSASLLVEVSDPLPDPPRERTASEHDEGGRGIQLVARESRRWGTRRGPIGKTVWFELSLPG